MSYNTRQKRQVLAFIKKLNQDFTAKDVYHKFDGKIGLTTIYRFIESLEKENRILRISSEGTSAKYQYIEPCKHTDHFYLKCENCGNLEHVDCKKIRGFKKHILRTHHFIPAHTNIIINGLCKNCTKGDL